MTAFAAHFAYELRAGVRNTTLQMMNYLFPLGFYGMMGLVMTRINPAFTETMIPAMVVFVAMVGPVLGLPSPLVEAREAGIFRTYKINGVPAVSILSIPALTAIVHSLICCSIIVLTASPLFGATPPQSWVSFAVLALITAFTFGGLGALIGVVAANGRATVLWSQLLFLPSMLIGGLMVPLALLPPSMLPVAALLPSARAMQALLGLSYGEVTALDPAASGVILAATGIVAAALAVYLFSWDRAGESRRGHPALGLLVLVPGVAGLLFT